MTRKRIAMVAADGSLSVVDACGAPGRGARGGGELRYGPPAWSPDGSRIAAIGRDLDTAAIFVFDVAGVGSGVAASRVVYETADRPPFQVRTREGLVRAVAGVSSSMRRCGSAS